MHASKRTRKRRVGHLLRVGLAPFWGWEHLDPGHEAAGVPCAVVNSKRERVQPPPQGYAGLPLICGG